MAADDFYTHSARTRIQRIDADIAQAKASLESAKAYADYDSAAENVQTIADLEAQRHNVLTLHQRYVDSQRVPEAPVLTDEELAALPPEKMTWDHALRIHRQTSKYGRDLTHDDPNVQAGYREVASGRTKQR